MDWSEKFEIAFNELINITINGNFDRLSEIPNLYSDLNSISNIEMFFSQKKGVILKLNELTKINLLQKLIELDKIHYTNREKDWYFANLFNLFFNLIFNDLNKSNKNEILDYILKNRKNERIPFAKDLDLKYNSLEIFNSQPLKKFSSFQNV